MNTYRPVAALIVKKEDLFLLVRKPRKHHAWQFPQGGVDEGETFVEAAKRELSEECGTEIQCVIKAEPIGEYQYEFPENFTRHDPGVVGARVVFFGADWSSGEPYVDGEELVEARWCTPTEIQELVEPEYWAQVGEWVL